jgi:hypothetical protein
MLRTVTDGCEKKMENFQKKWKISKKYTVVSLKIGFAYPEPATALVDDSAQLRLGSPSPMQEIEIKFPLTAARDQRARVGV